MKGVINIYVRRRKINSSRNYNDKWEDLRVIKLETVEKGFYKATHKDTGRAYFIHKDEVAFVRLIYNLFGDGDYSIQVYAKGKEKGYRRFWDGLIMNGKFFRRKELSLNQFREKVSLMEKESLSLNVESYIGRYMKTKRPGQWYTL